MHRIQEKQPSTALMENSKKYQSKMSTTPLVSVIIPMYNHAAYISECLDSIKSCGYQNLEILIIDDGSSDHSFQIARDWLDKYAAYFVHTELRGQENAGISVTFNRLIQLSLGEFIFPLASDDMVLPDAITTLVRFYLNNCKEPTLLFSDAEIIDTDSRRIAPSGAAYRGRDIQLIQRSSIYLKVDMMFAWGTPYQGQFFTRNLIDACGGYAESIKYEDLYFALLCAARFNIKYVPIAARRYRIRAGETLTPGLSETDLAPGAARRLVMPYFSPFYRFFLSMMNIRDEKTSGQGSEFAARLTHKIWRLTQLSLGFYHKWQGKNATSYP